MPHVVFLEQDGTRHEVEAPVGQSILEIAQANDIDLEGACEGSMACATCHVVVDDAWAGKLTPAKEEEEDMLDLAFDLQKNSRLGCQIIMTEALDGIVIRLPKKV